MAKRPKYVMPFELDDERRFIFIRLYRKKLSLERIADELLITPQRVHQIDNDLRFDFEKLICSNPALAEFAMRIVDVVNWRNESLDDYSNEAAIERLTANVETIKKVAPTPNRDSFKLSTDLAARKKVARRMFRKSLAEAASVSSNRLTLEKALDVLGDDAPQDVKTLDELLDRLTDSVL